MPSPSGRSFPFKGRIWMGISIPVGTPAKKPQGPCLRPRVGVGGSGILGMGPGDTTEGGSAGLPLSQRRNRLTVFGDPGVQACAEKLRNRRWGNRLPDRGSCNGGRPSHATTSEARKSAVGLSVHCPCPHAARRAGHPQGWAVVSASAERQAPFGVSPWTDPFGSSWQRAPGSVSKRLGGIFSGPAWVPTRAASREADPPVLTLVKSAFDQISNHIQRAGNRSLAHCPLLEE